MPHLFHCQHMAKFLGDGSRDASNDLACFPHFPLVNRAVVTGDSVLDTSAGVVEPTKDEC